MKNFFQNSKGAVTIIEAAFVFPITFFIVFFMIMTGEAYYQHARVEYLVTSYAISGAARCENPMLGQLSGDKVNSDPISNEILPYRYIFTGEAKTIGNQIASELDEKVSSMKPMAFRNMSPHNVNVKVAPALNPLISSFPVECSFEVPFPIKMIFTDTRLSFHYTVRMTASVGDPAEFIRNVAMIEDMMERNQGIVDFAGKVKEGMKKVGSITN